MRNAQKPDHIGFSAIIEWLREGRFVIPDFQREFEWEPSDIRDLMRSIFLDYYIGSLLLWKGTQENFSAMSCEPVYGYTGDARPDLIVLDGQQRLTAIYYACVAPDLALPRRTYRSIFFINIDKFMAGDYDEAFDYGWTNATARLHANQEAQFERHWFPLSVIGSGGWNLANWVQGYQAWWEAKATAASEAGNGPEAEIASQCAADAVEFGRAIKGIVDQFQITYVELDKELELDKVCDIFTQINSKGVKLDIFDLINALLKPKGLQLKRMYRDAKPRFEFMDSSKANVYVLQVMSILSQAYCSPKYLYYLLPGAEKKVRTSDGSLTKEVLIADTAQFQALWDRSVDALAKSLDRLSHPQEYGVTSAQYLPYQSIVPAFAALNTEAKKLDPSKQLDANRKIRHWYWASVFTLRYSGAVESRAARDFLDVKAWFYDDLAEPPPIGDFTQQFRNIEFRKLQSKGHAIYNGVFNLLVLQGARDWMIGLIPQDEELDDHHIVPQSWGKRESAVGSLVDSILNRTPLTSDTNRNVIKDRLPNAYLPELIASNGEDKVRSILETHFISATAFDILLRDPFTPEDFEAFISERQKTIQDAIESLLIKERLDLPLALRELDAGVEEVELGLRRVIADRLEDDPANLPPHLAQKIEERLLAAARKNAALDLDAYKKLHERLQYSDCRELQDIITNNLVWPLFEPMFRSKGTLGVKFDQLAELRNDIRHSRDATEVKRMEGQAAILWFGQVLGTPVADASGNDD